MTKQMQNEVLKVKEYFVVIVELRSDDNASLQREIVETIHKKSGVTAIIYQKRTVDKLKVIPERQLEKLMQRTEVRL